MAPPAFASFTPVAERRRNPPNAKIWSASGCSPTGAHGGISKKDGKQFRFFPAITTFGDTAVTSTLDERRIELRVSGTKRLGSYAEAAQPRA